jgi:hypothetical protein
VPTLDETLARLLAMSREAGTPAAAEARALVTAHLQALGYTVTVQRFTFHPSALDGFPLFGAGLGGLALLSVPLLVAASLPAWGAIVTVVGGVAALGLFAFGVGAGWISLGAPAREDANLLAVRDETPTRRWIVAHLDTKAQGHSMAGRLVALWVLGVAIAALLALAAVRLGGALRVEVAAAGAVLAIIAGALAGRGRLRGHSHGARDNGSGIAAALAAAEASQDAGTGILITGAEEFGMVGARVFARLAASRLPGIEVVNLDTIDEEGDLYLVTHDRAGVVLAEKEAERLRAAGLAPRTRRLPLGILVDSLPFARAGVPSLTVGRLTWRTLRIIHTPRDTAEGLTLAAAKAVGRALAVN